MWLRCRRARRWWRRRRITGAGAETVVKHLSLALQAALPEGSKVTSSCLLQPEKPANIFACTPLPVIYNPARVTHDCWGRTVE